MAREKHWLCQIVEDIGDRIVTLERLVQEFGLGGWGGYINATGGKVGGWTITATSIEGGYVTLDLTGGISIEAGAAYEVPRSYSFRDSAGTTIATLSAAFSATANYVQLEVPVVAGQEARTVIRSLAPTTEIANASFGARSGVIDAIITCRADDDAAVTDYIDLAATQIYLDGAVLAEHGITITDGQVLQWSDVNLYRDAANVLKTDDSFTVGGTTFTSIANTNLGSADASVLTITGIAVTIAANSVFTWGTDTTLYRSAANLLKTDDSLQVALGLNIGTATGAGTGEVKTSGAVLCQGLGVGTGSALTLDAAGEITVGTGTDHILDTFGGAASDDLVAINGGVAGQIIILRTAVDARDVTVKDVGALLIAGDMVLDRAADTIMLMCYTPGGWIELSRSNNI